MKFIWVQDLAGVKLAIDNGKAAILFSSDDHGRVLTARLYVPVLPALGKICPPNGWKSENITTDRHLFDNALCFKAYFEGDINREMLYLDVADLWNYFLKEVAVYS